MDLDKHISVRLDADLYGQVRAGAEAAGLGVSGYFRAMLAEGLAVDPVVIDDSAPTARRPHHVKIRLQLPLYDRLHAAAHEARLDSSDVARGVVRTMLRERRQALRKRKVRSPAEEPLPPEA